MEKITKEPNRRNCACFVANGVVYTKLKANAIKKQQGIEFNKRQKREVNHIIHESTPDEILTLLRLHEQLEMLSQEEVSETHTRHKRNTEDVVDVITEIQRNLVSLENTFRNNTQHPSEKCFVASEGRVNCSSSIYEDEKSWKRSRHQVDLLIKVLKKKISDLKDIRKHLKENKPNSIKDDYEDANSKEDEEKKLSENGKEKKFTDEETGPLIDLDWYTSTTEIAQDTRIRWSTSFSTTSAPESTVSSIVTTNGQTPKKRTNKRPISTTTTTTTSSPITLSTANTLEESDTNIPIFYIGEDKVEEALKPNMTTSGPEIVVTTTLSTTADITSNGEPDVTSTTPKITTTDSGTIKPNDTESSSYHPHRHNHGTNNNRSHHHEPKKNSDTTTGPAECYCDLENEGYKCNSTDNGANTNKSFSFQI